MFPAWPGIVSRSQRAQPLLCLVFLRKPVPISYHALFDIVESASLPNLVFIIMGDNIMRQGGPLADAIWDVCQKFCPMVAPAGVPLPKWKCFDRGARKKIAMKKGLLLGGHPAAHGNVDLNDFEIKRYTFLRLLVQAEHTNMRKKWFDVSRGGDEWHKEIRLFVLGVQASVRGVAPPFASITLRPGTTSERKSIVLDKHLCTRCCDYDWTLRHQHGNTTDVFELVGRHDKELLSLERADSWSLSDKLFRTHLHDVGSDWMSALDFGFVVYCANELAE